MDILISSNFERLLWYLSYETTSKTEDEENRKGRACKSVDGMMHGMKNDGRVEVPAAMLELARRDFVAECITDDQVS
jgi:threonine synthase